MSEPKLLTEFLKNQGVAEVGFSHIAESPYPNLTTAVTLVVPLLDDVVNGIDTAPTETYFHHYRTVNMFLDQTMLKACFFLRDKGFRAAPVPASQSLNAKSYAGLFSHKEAAVNAGLGWIGKNALFISEQYGPRVRLGTVFTDLPLPNENAPYQDGCGACHICRDKCPALAIKGVTYAPGMKREELFDAEACSNYMKQKFQKIGRGAVCGICMRHCPKGNHGSF